MLRWVRRLVFIGAIIVLALTLHLGTPWGLATGSQLIATLAGYGIGIYMRSHSHPYLHGFLTLGMVLASSCWASLHLSLLSRLTLMLATGYGYAAGLVLNIGWRRRFQKRPTRPLETYEEEVT